MYAFEISVTVIMCRSVDKDAAASTRSARITLLESMLTASSSSLVAMASQLSEAEERERSFSGRARWAHLRSMGDAKNLLHLVFNTAAVARFILFRWVTSLHSTFVSKVCVGVASTECAFMGDELKLSEL